MTVFVTDSTTGIIAMPDDNRASEQKLYESASVGLDFSPGCESCMWAVEEIQRLRAAISRLDLDLTIWKIYKYEVRPAGRQSEPLWPWDLGIG